MSISCLSTIRKEFFSMSLSHFQQSPVLVAGLARNCGSRIRQDVWRLQQSLSGCQNLSWLVIESDSSDDTVAQLDRLSQDLPGFRYLSFGHLRSQIPLRTARIAHCRNTYLHELRTNPIYQNLSYLIVSDLDGLNTELTSTAIESCFLRDDWDVCTANQRGPYYDLFALRHPVWSPGNCWDQFAFLLDHHVPHELALRGAVHSKMITIPSNENWIEVDSAFGGFAVYKVPSLGNATYHGLSTTGSELCEHVPFHAQLKAAGHRLFINPKLINTSWTEHTRHLQFLPTLKRRLLSLTKSSLTSTIGPTAFEWLKSKLASR
jgi:hypothetical protein